MRTTWNFNTAGQLLFGRNVVDQIGDRVRQMGARRLLLVTDQTLLDAGLVDRVSAPLRDADVTVEVFAGGSPEPPLHAVNDAIAAARDCGAEVLLGLGGGSNMDIAKAAAVVLAHGGAVKDYAGDQVVPGPVFPLILVPTTSGTGSEVTAAAAVEKLNADIGIPLHLRDVGISEAQLPAMADKAFTVKRILRVSPRSVAHDDLEAILGAAL